MSAVNNYIASLGGMDFGYEESLDSRCRHCLDDGYLEVGGYCDCWAGRAAMEQDALDGGDVA